MRFGSPSGRLSCAALAVLCTAALLGACSPSDQPEQPPEASAEAGDALWGRTFHSLTVTERGEPRELHWEHDFREDEPHIELRFALRGEEGLIDVWAGCNHMSGSVEVTDTELEARITDITDRDCDPPELHEQDDWLRHTFLRSGPTWELDGSHLTLRSEDTVIEFEEVNG